VADLFRNLLLVTQGTEFDAGAERVAIEIAARWGIPASAVLPLVVNPESESIAPLEQEAAEAEARAALDRLQQAAAGRGVELEVVVRRGEEPAAEILAEARERPIDVIVLRRRGKRGFLANLLIGEMVHTVTSHAPCHVLIVPRASNMWSRGIALATDGSPHSQRAAEIGASIALRCGLPLTIVSVRDEQDADGSLAQARVNSAMAVAHAIGADARGEVATGRPYEAILRTAERAGCDLIVLGRRGLRGIKRVLLGSTSEQVAGHASAPVLIIHAPP